MKLLKNAAVAALCLVGVLGTVACGGNGSPEPSPVPPEKPIVTEYVDAVKSPDPEPISDSVSYTAYYVDSVGGNDANDGLSADKAKASLTAANAIIASVESNVPTKVLFKAGTEYRGTLRVGSYSAKKESPLILSVYGETEQSRYAKIVCGEAENCIELKGDNVRISRFECTSEGGEGYRGLYAKTDKKGASSNIVVNENWFHDFSFRMPKMPEGMTLPTDETNLSSNVTTALDPLYARDCGGIIFEADTPAAKGPSWYENVWLDDNIIERVSRTGIWFNSYWAQRPGMDWGRNPYYDDETNYYPHYNIQIRRNAISYTGGDGCVLLAARNSFLEGNTCYHAQVLGRNAIPNAGLWIHSCTDTVFQYNEAAYTHFRSDGQGFDIDIGCSNILFQYNYSHHNEGGGLLCCNTKTWIVEYDKNGEMVLDEDGCPVQKEVAGDWHNVVVKNNVFADNRWADMIFSGKVDDIRFENNTIIKSGKKGDRGIVIETKDFEIGIPGKNWTIGNNIFYARQPLVNGDYQFLMDDFSTKGGYKLEDNVYYGFSEEVETALKGFGESALRKIDPKFTDGESKLGFANAYQLKANNPEIYTGAKRLPLALKYDFKGIDATGLFYYGAFAKLA